MKRRSGERVVSQLSKKKQVIGQRPSIINSLVTDACLASDIASNELGVFLYLPTKKENIIITSGNDFQTLPYLFLALISGM